MRTEILTALVKESINWDKPQWVVSNKNEVTFIVFTDGEHENDCFSGQCLPNNVYERGEDSNCWIKSNFKPIPKEGLPIKITNE